MDRFRHNPDKDHTIPYIMFEYGKFHTMRGWPPPTKNEYREVLEMEGFDSADIEAALKDL